jgi:2-polyprenyl-6-methoxyphenol hydroxylase-like FAD-dependent oxidoreductase
MTDIDVPVLVVGGGPTGLALSLALSRVGTGSLLVDKHAGTSNHPKATVVNVRTMELCRQFRLLAKAFKVPRRAVTILTGHNARLKQVSIGGVPAILIETLGALTS